MWRGEGVDPGGTREVEFHAMKTREVVFYQDCCDHCHGEPKQCPDVKSLSPASRKRWARHDYPGEALSLVRDFVSGHADLADLKRFVCRVDELAVVP